MEIDRNRMVLQRTLDKLKVHSKNKIKQKHIMKEQSVSAKQGKKALLYLIVQYQTAKIKAERTIQMVTGIEVIQ